MQKPILKNKKAPKPLLRDSSKGQTVDYVRIEITQDQAEFLLENARNLIHSIEVGNPSYIRYNKGAG